MLSSRSQRNGTSLWIALFAPVFAVGILQGSSLGQLSANPVWTAESNQAGGQLGESVASAGDVNGDGYDDLIVGGPLYDGAGTDCGRVWVFHGSASGPSVSADWSVDGSQAGAELGNAVASAGDVNGDGYEDVIIGVHSYWNGSSKEGRALVFHGSASGLSATPAWTLDGTQVGGELGYSVGSAGDVDGDGYDDVVVGAPFYNQGATDNGRAWLYYGSSTGLLTTTTWGFSVGGFSASFAYVGGSVGSAGDVNDDGYDDMLVSGWHTNSPFGGGEGGVWCFYGSVSGPSTTPSWQLLGTQFQGLLGWSVSTAGDVNGDGYDDVIVGETGWDDPAINAGRASAYHGSVAGLSATADWVVTGGQAGVQLGFSVDTVGDADGDGYDDVIVGLPFWTGPESAEGAVWLYRGSPSGLSTTVDWTAERNQASASMGYSVAAAGDVNWDGFDDAIVGAPHYDNPSVNEGQAYLYTGESLVTTGTLALAMADCQDDVLPGEPGYQVEVELNMLSLTGAATGFQAFVEYDASLAYRGDLSSYTNSPFPLHLSPILQPDDGRLELDGSDVGGGMGTSADALLATLVFDVAADCGPTTATFEVAGAFPSELSFTGVPFPTTLVDALPSTLDDTPPVFSGIPADITVSAEPGCSGAAVTWTAPIVVDVCDPSPELVADASPGFFPVGTTTVTYTATDACGNVATAEFDVQVDPLNDFVVDIELDGVMTPGSRCVRIVLDGCTVATDVSLAFTDHDSNASTPVRATANLTLPCGTYTSLCVKDEQLTKWGATTLAATSSSYVGNTLVSLVGGDTDNDGDVDIHDVTLLLARFGLFAQSGGCPWDGTRDADFSGNGVVGIEDYSFLTASWITTSSCACALAPKTPPRAHDLRTPVGESWAVRADLNGDGWVDWRDVDLFEEFHGLPHDLSDRIRVAERAHRR